MYEFERKKGYGGRDVNIDLIFSFSFGGEFLKMQLNLFEKWVDKIIKEKRMLL